MKSIYLELDVYKLEEALRGCSAMDRLEVFDLLILSWKDQGKIPNTVKPEHASIIKSLGLRKQYLKKDAIKKKQSKAGQATAKMRWNHVKIEFTPESMLESAKKVWDYYPALCVITGKNLLKREVSANDILELLEFYAEDVLIYLIKHHIDTSTANKTPMVEFKHFISHVPKDNR